MVPTREEMETALAARHGTELQKKFCAASVAVCGLGGLGSNVCLCLARAGIGRLHIIDFDSVDISNLNRQQYTADQIGMSKAEAMTKNLKAAAPYCDIKADRMMISPENIEGLFDDEDIIIEAFDAPEQKVMLTEEVLTRYPDKYFIAAAGMAGLGSANDIRTQRIGKRFYLCGDGVSDVAELGSLFSARVMTCAAHEATVALRIIAGEYEA